MTDPRREQILDTALALANETSWERLRLHQVAERLHLSLEQITPHFQEKEDLVNAWFDRADRALLRASETITELNPRARLKALLLSWLAALAPYARVTREMVAGKLEFGHVHFQAAGLLRISRTVQWWREAAHRTAPLPWRALDETGLTAIYLATFTFWLNDRSQAKQASERFLDRLLACAEPAGRFLREGRG